MTTRYPSGHGAEAITLFRTADSMRLALQGTEDVLELKWLHGAWINNSGDFAAPTYSPRQELAEAGALGL